MLKYAHYIDQIRNYYGKDHSFIPLHEPCFNGNEKAYLNECIDSTFVSSVGPFVDRFEDMMKELTGSKHAIAVVNGTAALHLALIVAGVHPGDLVITQSLSFVATTNAILYTGAIPYFVDVEQSNLSMSSQSLKDVLKDVELKNGIAIHLPTGKRVAAVVPMHTFGFSAHADELESLCQAKNIPLIEDAAESLGTFYKGKHSGTFGLLGTFSFNGNKTITSGGGGILVTNDDSLGKLAKHLSTQAKKPHAWEYDHDMQGYNYRCPNINAALACAQLEQLEDFLTNKHETATFYKELFFGTEIQHITEEESTKANYWLNAILLPTKEERDQFLKETNDSGVMTRPAWNPLHELSYLKDSFCGDLSNTHYIADRLVNLPSSVRK
jgi:perosamine synthetase